MLALIESLKRLIGKTNVPISESSGAPAKYSYEYKS
jgi:hypothetical protein